MLRLIMRAALMLAPVLLLSVAGIRLGYAWAHPFPDAGVFSLSRCSLPCWMGLEVGTTSHADTEQVLRGFEVTAVSGEQTNFNVHHNLRGILNRSDALDSLTLYYTGCPLGVVRELGKPNLIERNRTPNDLFFYYREGLILQVDVGFNYGNITVLFRDPDDVAAYISSSGNTRLTFDAPIVQGLLHDCP